MNLWQYVQAAGAIGYILTILSIFSVTIIFERIYYWLQQGKTPNKNLQTKLIDTFSKNDAKKIKNVSNQLVGPEKRAILYLAKHLEKTDDSPLDVALSREIRSTNSGLTLLELNSGIAPMLGILGTVVGVIYSFKGISGGMPDTGVMVSGISISMLTTAIGLVVALLSIIPFTILANRAYKRQVSLSELLQECWSAKNSSMTTINIPQTKLAIANSKKQENDK